MKDSLTSVKRNAQIAPGTLTVLLAGVFLTSFSLLALEITLSRILSALIYYHYVFVVISMALLGLGIGALFAQLLRVQFSDEHHQFGWLALFASLMALSIPLSVIIMSSLANSPWESILTYSFLMFLPFFFAGVMLATIFRAFTHLSSQLYGVDLIGAALGILGAILMLNLIGGFPAIAVISLIALLSAGLFAAKAIGSIKKVMTGFISLSLVLSLFGTALLLINRDVAPLGMNAGKDIYHTLSESSGAIVDTRWSAFGRTDLIAFPDDPEIMAIFVDGTAGSPMFKFDGNPDNPNPRVQTLKEFTGFLPMANLADSERNNALIIGPGGGRDVLLTMLAGVGQITAVEVNRDVVDMVTKYREYNGGIYTDLKNVSIIVDEGRSYLKRQREKYDIIMLSLPITKTSRSLEGFSLTENFLFTTESINDYLEHLTDEGRLIVVAHSPDEIYRLLSVSLEAFSRNGISNEAAMNQIYFIGSNSFPVFVMKKTPFTLKETMPLHQVIHERGYDLNASFLPAIKLGKNNTHLDEQRFDECSMLNLALLALDLGLITIGDLNNQLGTYGMEVKTITDDSPFFYKLERGIPVTVSLVLWLALIILLLTIAGFFISRRFKSSRSSTGLDGRFMVFFTLLGIGFMLVEITVIQKFTLFLGQPVTALAVSLFSLLVGAGLGSLYSSRFAPARIPKVITVATLSIVVMLLIYALTLSPLLRGLIALSLVARVVMVSALLLPLGFWLGFPFPLGMRLMKELNREKSIPWMWGFNGIGSVAGSALTILLAISFSFTWALIAGMLSYLLVFLLGHRYKSDLAGQKIQMD